MPSDAMVAPTMARIVETCTTASVVNPARNLPLYTSSRCTGWERTRASVPCDLSLFMLSNPRMIPASGPKKLMKKSSDGRTSLLEENTFRNRNSSRLLAAASTVLNITERAQIIASDTRASRNTKRRRPKWSAISFQKIAPIYPSWKYLK